MNSKQYYDGCDCLPDVLTFPVVPDLHPPDGVGAANAVIVRHHQLQAHSLHQVIS